MTKELQKIKRMFIKFANKSFLEQNDVERLRILADFINKQEQMISTNDLMKLEAQNYVNIEELKRKDRLSQIERFLHILEKGKLLEALSYQVKEAFRKKEVIDIDKEELNKIFENEPYKTTCKILWDSFNDEQLELLAKNSVTLYTELSNACVSKTEDDCKLCLKQIKEYASNLYPDKFMRLIQNLKLTSTQEKIIGILLNDLS